MGRYRPRNRYCRIAFFISAIRWDIADSSVGEFDKLVSDLKSTAGLQVLLAELSALARLQAGPKARSQQCAKIWHSVNDTKWVEFGGSKSV